MTKESPSRTLPKKVILDFSNRYLSHLNASAAMQGIIHGRMAASEILQENAGEESFLSLPAFCLFIGPVKLFFVFVNTLGIKLAKQKMQHPE